MVSNGLLFKTAASYILFHALAAIFISHVASGNLAENLPFDPRDYPKKIVTCPAINRAQDTQVDIDLRMNLLCF
jgi:hypothetical protein